MSWTQPSDVTEAWIGEGAPTDEDLIQRWIDKAEREVKYRVPDIQTRITTEADAEPPRDDLEKTVVDVVVSMVTRVFRNPEGIRQRNTTTGPFTESATYGGDIPGGLGMSDEELAKLQAKSQGAFTISMIPSTSPFSPDFVSGVTVL